MKTPLNQNWDIDVFFPGGSASKEYQDFLLELEEDVEAFVQLVKNNEGNNAEEGWEKIVDSLQNFILKFGQAAAFLGCLNSQNIFDRQAQQLSGRIRLLGANFSTAKTMLDQQMLNLDEETWQKLLASPVLKQVQFALNEAKELARNKLPLELEALVNALSIDGYHAWGDLYGSKIVSRMSIEMEKEGEIQQLSIGQATNLLADTNRDIRRKAYEKIEEAWAKEAELCAAALNHLAGFRINLYKKRGWQSILKEPLFSNRMTEATLNAMWKAVEEGKPKLVKYLERKAKLLGIDKITWYDLDAPIGNVSKTIPYEEGAQFIVEQFHHFNPEMADFALHAFNNRWIEAENRPSKSPGAFCTGFPKDKESRIFMTYSGTASNVETLAHELGHAYHSHVMRDLPPLTQRYSMSVAETASTFSELIVADAAIKNARDDAEALTLLADKVQRIVSFFMNIHARFIFEMRFYEERQKGLLRVEELNQMMEEAQKEAYHNALACYHPHFWASKLHFYSTGVPFYNFPYTFGFLFSSGVYARAQEEGPGFANRYIELLRDTGRMTVEALAQKHLDADLTRPDFWRDAVNVNLADVDKFLALT